VQGENIQWFTFIICQLAATDSKQLVFSRTEYPAGQNKKNNFISMGGEKGAVKK
jgi:hypothetical protein